MRKPKIVVISIKCFYPIPLKILKSVFFDCAKVKGKSDFTVEETELDNPNNIIEFSCSFDYNTEVDIIKSCFDIASILSSCFTAEFANQCELEIVRCDITDCQMS